MTGPFETAIGLAQATLKKAGPVATVVLRRGTAVTNGVTAIIGQTRTEVGDNENITTEGRMRDFLIDVADYKFAGVASQPKQYDEIDQVIGSKTHTWQVLPVGGDKPFRPSDPFGKRWRIHAQLKGIA